MQLKAIIAIALIALATSACEYDRASSSAMPSPTPTEYYTACVAADGTFGAVSISREAARKAIAQGLRVYTIRNNERVEVTRIEGETDNLELWQEVGK